MGKSFLWLLLRMMENAADLKSFDREKIVMCRHLWMSIFETILFMDCLRLAVVNIYSEWMNGGETSCRHHGVEHSRDIKEKRHRWLSRVVTQLHVRQWINGQPNTMHGYVLYCTFFIWDYAKNVPLMAYVDEVPSLTTPTLSTRTLWLSFFFYLIHTQNHRDV